MQIGAADQAGHYEIRRDQADPGNGVGKVYCLKVDKTSDPWYSTNSTRRAEVVAGTGHYMTMGTEYLFGYSIWFEPDMFGHGGQAIDLHDMHAIDWETTGLTAVNPCIILLCYSNNRLVAQVRWDPNNPPLATNVNGGSNGAGIETIWDDTTIASGQWIDFVWEVRPGWSNALHNNPYARLHVAKNNGALSQVGSRTGPNCYHTVGATGATQVYWKGGLYAWFTDTQFGSKPTRTIYWSGFHGLTYTGPGPGEPTLTPDVMLAWLRGIRPSPAKPLGPPQNVRIIP